MKIKDMSSEQINRIINFPCISKNIPCDGCACALPKGVNGILNCASISLKYGMFKIVKDLKIDMRKVR